MLHKEIPIPLKAHILARGLVCLSFFSTKLFQYRNRFRRHSLATVFLLVFGKQAHFFQHLPRTR
jgi:hypothetical protein